MKQRIYDNWENEKFFDYIFKLTIFSLQGISTDSINAKGIGQWSEDSEYTKVDEP